MPCLTFNRKFTKKFSNILDFPQKCLEMIYAAISDSNV